MQVTTTIAETRRERSKLGRLALVPTMGALHEGHLSLVRRAREVADHVAVSIFVNPTQFGPNEDLDRYPRPIERDLALCKSQGVSLVWNPPAEHVYPPNELETTIDVPPLTDKLEGAHRPGHFVGVCRVVTKLLNVFHPELACFGMKDFQQLRVIEAMTAAMCLPVEIVRCPTVREADGLAMSSRNQYLSDDDRRHALGLHKALEEARQLVAAEEPDPDRVERAMRQVLEMHHAEVDYAVAREPRTLEPIDMINVALEPVICLVAARVGNTRLIDNMLMTPAVVEAAGNTGDKN